ncbi:hypothetical protein E2562_000276 [Oryza meyeriana var. granulata]|uniref:Uncharacterized protein n=1 Tax=Oryza meyeriana var. granulata TaxID=110450 RepID=A0A6G1CL66_9ORYZ|nr:hypothetical protein E2562_000276 [Oryza meyeriana var. granulata]
MAQVIESTCPRPRHSHNPSTHYSSGPRGRGPRASFLASLSGAWDLVEELREATLARWAELDEMCSALTVEEAHLQKGRQQLESLVHVAKAVNDRNVAKVEREQSTLDAECVEAVAAREDAPKALRELDDQRKALTILKAGKGLRTGAHTPRGGDDCTGGGCTQREGVLRTAEARVRQSYEDVHKHEEQLVL